MAQNVVEYILDIKTKAAERGLDRVADSLDDVNDELQETQRESKKTSSALEQFKKVGVSLGSVGAVIGAVSVAIAGAGAAAFSAAKKVTDLVNELNDLSVRSGVSAKTIQGLRQAMLSSGQSAEGLTEVLGAISGQFAQLSTEGSAVEKKFMSFGIAVKDTSGELRSNNDILLDSIKLLQGISDSSDRSRTAVTLFGEAGAKLNQALAAGDFEKFLQFVDDYGVRVTPQATRVSAQFQFTLSSLQTVLDGVLQKFVTATDGQNRFITAMIKVGKAVVFVGSLIDSFAKEIDYLTKVAIDTAIGYFKLLITNALSPLSVAIRLQLKLWNTFLGLFFDIDKIISDVTGKVFKFIDPTDRLSTAISQADQEADKFEKTMQDLNNSLSVLQTGSQGAFNELNDLGKEAEKTTDKIRTLTDVVNDLLGRFIKIDIAKVLGDFNLIFSSLSFNLEKQFFQLRQNLQRILNPFGLLNQQEWMEFLSDPIKRAEFEAQKSQGRLKKLFAKGLLTTITKTQDIFSNDFFRDLKSKFQNVIKGASEGGLLGAFQALGTGGKIVSVIASILLAGIKIAAKLGQKARSEAEIREMQRRRREEGKAVTMTVAEVQQRDIQKSVEEDIRARAKAIEIGLQALPRILFDVLPKVFIEFVDRIIFGFQKALAEFINMQLERLKALFTREGRQALAEGIKNGFRASFDEFLRRINVLGGILSKRSGGRYIPSARGGIKFTGADEGLAMLHRGEFVVPETGQMPQAVQRTMGMGQSGINITINASVVESNAIDELVRQIERRFQTFGSSTSPLFGGR